jgi:hypothetical protein
VGGVSPSPLKEISEPTPKSQPSQLGQYMTPATIATFMAAMFEGQLPATVRLLDAGAGRGVLTGAFIARWKSEGVMARYLSEIAWETEVWVADPPSHLIHFNGVRLLGPYPAPQ